MRFRRTSGIIIFFLSVAIATANVLALKYFLYWRVWWYDIPMHFLGGVIIAAIALWFIAYEVPLGVRSRIPRLAVALTTAFVIGVLWEVFEYTVGITVHEAGYLADTLQDVVLDTMGGWVAYLIMKKYGT